MLAAAVVACSGAVADAAGPPALASLNSVRRQLGLRALVPDPAAQQIVARMAKEDTDDRVPLVLDAQPPCSVCEGFFEEGHSVDPVAEYGRLGGRGKVGFALWRAGWTAKENLSVFFAAAALVLDPRARTFAAARTPRWMLVIAVSVDAAAPFRRARRWPVKAADPRRQLWVQALFPPGQGYPHLYDRRGERDVTVAYPLAMARGLAGARLVAFGLNTSLAYDRAYHVGIGRLALPLRTRTPPAAFLARSWSFTSIGRARRRAFLDIVESTPLVLRRLLQELDGAVEVAGGNRACFIADACEEAVGDRARVGFTRAIEPFVVLHELGHVVFDLALDERGRRIFLAALQRAGWDEYCCINLFEVFADQLAFWALGGMPPGVATYSDRVYLRGGGFARLLRENAAYRPQPTVGLLAR